MRKPPPYNRKWVFDIDEAARMYRGGQGLKAIADHLGVPLSSVRYALRSRGVSNASDWPERCSRMWRDPGGPWEQVRGTATARGLASALSPNHDVKSWNDSRYHPKGVHYSPATELKQGDPRVAKMALLGRSKQKPRFHDTSIERRLGSELHRLGLDFATHIWVSGAQPDILFYEAKVAVFCDGDYWHNLPNYKARDQRINSSLAANGWTALRFWEHEINSDVRRCAMVAATHIVEAVGIRA